MSYPFTRVLHIITDLDSGGGAEMMLYRLLANSHWNGVQNAVVSLMNPGPLASQFERAGVRCYGLGMRRGSLSASGCRRLQRILTSEQPDVVQTWMYHANLVGGISARLAGVRRVFWAIHHANLSPSLNKWSTLLIARACAHLSKVVPTTSIFCSRYSAELHWSLGYSERRSVVIPNGFDTDLFRPDPEASLTLRKELGVGPDTILIGLIARFDILKDHKTFCKAAALLDNPNVHFVLAGNGITRDNAALLCWLREAGVDRRTHLLGLRQDMPSLCAALDILTSSSAGEAFPIIIGETMACGVPCVATDVGDCADIIGRAGIVVPPRNSPALAEGWRHLLTQSAEQRRILGRLARERIVDNFSIVDIAARYRALYLGVLSGCPT